MVFGRRLSFSRSPCQYYCVEYVKRSVCDICLSWFIETGPCCRGVNITISTGRLRIDCQQFYLAPTRGTLAEQQTRSFTKTP